MWTVLEYILEDGYRGVDNQADMVD